MGFAVLLTLVAGVFWIIFLILQFFALISLVAIGLAIWAVIAMYGLSFIGLYFILGPEQIGGAIFGAFLLGTMLLKTTVRHLKSSH